MTYDEAKELLKGDIKENGGLSRGSWWVSWDIGKECVCIDGEFPVDYLEAIVVYIKEMSRHGQ